MATPIRTKLKVVNPEVSDSPRTYLSADVDASPGASTTLQVLSKRGFYLEDRDPTRQDESLPQKTEYYILIGDYNQEKTELKRVAADDTDNKSLTVNELSNSHSAADPVTVIDYNKINVYGATLPGGTRTLLATIDIDMTQSFTEYVYEYVEGVDSIQYSYFTTTFLNSEYSEESQISEEVEGTTFNRRSIKRIIESGAIKALTRIEESPTSVLNWDNAVDIVQDGIDEILTRKRNWSFWKKTYAGISTTINGQTIGLPSDMGIPNFITVDGQKIRYVSEMAYLQMTDFDSNTTEKGLPRFYTLKNDLVYLFPTADKSYTVVFDYFYIPATVEELSDTVNIAIVPILIYYCAAMFAYIRGNDKRGDKMYAMFTKLLEQQVDEFTGPEQLGDAESVEETNSIYWEE